MFAQFKRVEVRDVIAELGTRKSVRDCHNPKLVGGVYRAFLQKYRQSTFSNLRVYNNLAR
jgi:hypothetical protein